MSYIYSFVSQDFKETNVIPHGGSLPVTIKVKNTGTDTWQKTGANAVKLGTSHPNDRVSGFYDSATWLANNRIAMQETSVAPNATATFSFTLKVPKDADTAGSYNEFFNLVAEGITWMPDINMFIPVLVPARVGTFLFGWYGASDFGWVGASTPGDADAVAPDTPTGGRYNSLDTSVIRRQLQQIQDAGIDFVVIDFWWDNNIGGSYATKTRDHFAAVIALMESEFPNLRVCPLIEPQPSVDVAHDVPPDCYSYFQTNYGSSPVFMTHLGKKLMFTFCKRRGAVNTNFNTLSMCNDSAAGYSFNFWSVPAVPLNNYMSIMHRFDNRHLPIATSYRVSNPSYAEGVWHDQCSVAKANRYNLKLLMVAPWNEYHERQQIEPHTNFDSNVPDDYAYKQVKSFILDEWRV